MADDLRLFGITGDWSTAALDPGVWYSAVHEGAVGLRPRGWVKEEENASSHRQKKREAEETDKVVEVAPGVTVASLRRFRAALIGPTQGLTKRRRLCRFITMKRGKRYAFGCMVAIRGGYRMARGWHYTKLSLSSALLLCFYGMYVYFVIVPFFLSFLFCFPMFSVFKEKSEYT